MNFSPSEIMSFNNPCELFPNSLEDSKTLYRELAKQFHPDVYKGSKKGIFAHITTLYNEAISMIEAGTWDHPYKILITSIDNKKYNLKFKTKIKFELGMMYITRTNVVYIIDSEQYYNKYINTLKNIKYSNDNIRKNIKLSIPTITHNFKTSDNKYCIVVNKPEDVYPLQNIVDYYKNIDPRHVAWIMNRLYYFSCFLLSNGISLNDISMNTIFVCPSYHSIMVLGGWFYSTLLDENIKTVPKHTFNVLPAEIKKNKLTKTDIDQALIKQIGREICGDVSGMTLEKNGIPKPMSDYLRLPVYKNPIDAYKEWDTKILKESFGEKKFVVMDYKED